MNEKERKKRLKKGFGCKLFAYNNPKILILIGIISSFF